MAHWAYSGTGIAAFKGKPVKNLRGIASLYPEAIQIVATKASGIKSVSDLRGKRVVVGAPGSGTEVDARIILGVHGITYEDIEEDFLGFSEAVQRIKDNQADAAFVTAGFPTSSIIDLATTHATTIVSISEDKLKELVKDYPYYARAIIPGGTYPGVDQPAVTVATPALWLVDSEVPEELVYKVTKALWERQVVLRRAEKTLMSGAEHMARIHAKGKDVTLDTALDGMGIPLHPGAEKYYREKGLIK